MKRKTRFLALWYPRFLFDICFVLYPFHMFRNMYTWRPIHDFDVQFLAENEVPDDYFPFVMHYWNCSVFGLREIVQINSVNLKKKFLFSSCLYNQAALLDLKKISAGFIQVHWPRPQSSWWRGQGRCRSCDCCCETRNDRWLGWEQNFEKIVERSVW